MRLAEYTVGEQSDLSADKRASGDLEVRGVQSVPVFGDMPDEPTRRGEPQFADAVSTR